MLDGFLTTLAGQVLGQGYDKKLPFLVEIYKKASSLAIKEEKVLVPLPEKALLWVSTRDTGVGLFLRAKGEYEPLQTRVFLESLKKGETVLDLGANIGYYTILASKKVGPKGRVIAVEPDQKNLAWLYRNIKVNQSENVWVVEGALGRKESLVGLKKDTANFGESQLCSLGEGPAVKVFCLEKVLQERRVQKVDLIKLDVEGAEVEVLAGAKDFLKKAKKVRLLVECHPRTLAFFSQTPEGLVRSLKSLGFKPKKIVSEFEKKIFRFSEKKLKESLLKASFVTVYAEKN